MKDNDVMINANRRWQTSKYLDKVGVVMCFVQGTDLEAQEIQPM